MVSLSQSLIIKVYQIVSLSVSLIIKVYQIVSLSLSLIIKVYGSSNSGRAKVNLGCC